VIHKAQFGEIFVAHSGMGKAVVQSICWMPRVLATILASRHTKSFFSHVVFCSVMPSFAQLHQIQRFVLEVLILLVALWLLQQFACTHAIHFSEQHRSLRHGGRNATENIVNCHCMRTLLGLSGAEAYSVGVRENFILGGT
jgi:hypothetical protein